MPATPASFEQYQSVRQAAQTLSISYQYALNLVHAGKLASVRSPWGTILVPASSVEQYAQQRAVRRTPGVPHNG